MLLRDWKGYITSCIDAQQLVSKSGGHGFARGNAYLGRLILRFQNPKCPIGLAAVEGSKWLVADLFGPIGEDVCLGGS